MMQADNHEKEEHLMYVICEVKDNYLVCKILVFVGSLIVDCYL